MEVQALRQHAPARTQVTITDRDERAQHGLIEKEVPHPLGDNEVRLPVQLKRLVVGVVKPDLWMSRIPRNAPRVMDKAGALNGVYGGGSAARRKNREHARASTKIDHSLTWSHLLDRSLVAAGSNRILQHHLMDGGVPIGLGKGLSVMGTFHEP